MSAGRPSPPDVPRPEYPRPQFARERWECLNGAWEFEIDERDDGEERGLHRRHLDHEILVPFAPETPRSGIEAKGFLPAVWYRRDIEVPAGWAGYRLLLHFQAVDYDATIWCNGQCVGRHLGGSTVVTCELTGVAQPGERATIVVRARDDPGRAQPRGKQSDQLGPYGSRTVRTTGIWQSVWLEPVPSTYLLRPKLTPSLSTGSLLVSQRLRGDRRSLRARVSVYDDEGIVEQTTVAADAEMTTTLISAIPAGRRRLWSPEDPYRYRLSIALVRPDDELVDEIRSYFGLRSLAVTEGAVLLNGAPRFQRLVLDQGYWPGTGWTAPSEEDLVRDITMSLAAGFDGARAHQRVAEERWLYHADRLGYLVWGEFPDWCVAGGDSPAAVHHRGFPIEYAGEWLETLERAYSHPSIVAWCALNETEKPPGGRLEDLDAPTNALFLAAREVDGTRPVLDVSGYHHRRDDADLWDCHDYEQDLATFSAHYAQLPRLAPQVSSDAADPWPAPAPGQPIFVSEFGGVVLAPGAAGQASADNQAASADELLQRFGGLCRTLLENPFVAGYCYTQLTDTYEERNGLLTADRRPKLPLADLAAVQSTPPAIEARVRPLDGGPGGAV